MQTTSTTWSVYIIEASDTSFYTGITTDVERRFKEHMQCRKGAKYFNGRKEPKNIDALVQISKKLKVLTKYFYKSCRLS